MGDRAPAYWFSQGRSPRGAERVVPLISAYLHVEHDWFVDGKESPVRYRHTTPQDATAVREVNPKARRIIYAIADPETLDYLDGQLDVWERLRARARRAPA